MGLHLRVRVLLFSPALMSNVHVIKCDVCQIDYKKIVEEGVEGKLVLQYILHIYSRQKEIK